MLPTTLVTKYYADLRTAPVLNPGFKALICLVVFLDRETAVTEHNRYS